MPESESTPVRQETRRKVYLPELTHFDPDDQAYYYVPDSEPAPRSAAEQGSRAYYYQPPNLAANVNVRVPTPAPRSGSTAPRPRNKDRTAITFRRLCRRATRTATKSAHQWMENGQLKEATRTVRFRAGDGVVVDFTRS